MTVPFGLELLLKKQQNSALSFLGLSHRSSIIVNYCIKACRERKIMYIAVVTCQHCIVI